MADQQEILFETQVDGKTCVIKKSARSPRADGHWVIACLDEIEETETFRNHLLTALGSELVSRLTTSGKSSPRLLWVYNSPALRGRPTLHFHAVPLDGPGHEVPSEWVPLPTEWQHNLVDSKFASMSGNKIIRPHHVVDPLEELDLQVIFRCQDMTPAAIMEGIVEIFASVVDWADARQKIREQGYRLFWFTGENCGLDSQLVHMMVPPAGRKLWRFVAGYEGQVLQPVK